MRSTHFISKVVLLMSTGLLDVATSLIAQELKDVNTFGNNTLFNKWRPSYHFIAPAGWMNDPCGAMYDPTREEYHLFYQWHPNHVNWGNISWGHAISKDLVSWHDVAHTGKPAWKDDNAAALWPSEDYDILGIFSGTAQPVNLKGEVDGTLLIFYTSIRALPTNWRLPYIPGTESHSFAISHDGGRTWGKYSGNPVIENPPVGWNITGWRDPFFEPSPHLDSILGQKEPHYYMVLGSGIKGVGPRIPMYAAPARDLTKWRFMGSLWEPKENTSYATVEKTGNQGFNFEVSGFHSLVDDEENKVHWFVSMGAEGGSAPGHGRWSLWSEAVVKNRWLEGNKSAEFEIVSSGVADWGNLYALTSFDDKKHNRRVQWGWSDEDLAGNGITALGYQGVMGLPRELFIKKYTYALNLPSTYLTTKGSFSVTQNHHDNDLITYTAITQGVRPLPDVVSKLRKSATGRYSLRPSTIKSGKDVTIIPLTDPRSGVKNIRSDKFNLHAKITQFSKEVNEVGFVVRMDSDKEEWTSITYNPSEARINVYRESSSLHPGFNNFTNWGHFQPLTTIGITNDGEPKWGVVDEDEEEGPHRETEAIEISIYVDNSLLEVFVNDRFALTTRIYPWKDDSTLIGYYLKGGSARFEHVKVWTGIGGKKNSLAWPDRPIDSSSDLVWDGPDRSGNFTYWPGN